MQIFVKILIGKTTTVLVRCDWSDEGRAKALAIMPQERQERWSDKHEGQNIVDSVQGSCHRSRWFYNSGGYGNDNVWEESWWFRFPLLMESGDKDGALVCRVLL